MCFKKISKLLDFPPTKNEPDKLALIRVSLFTRIWAGVLLRIKRRSSVHHIFGSFHLCRLYPCLVLFSFSKNRLRFPWLTWLYFSLTLPYFENFASLSYVSNRSNWRIKEQIWALLSITNDLLRTEDL